jgi:hypothetical protein
MIRSVALLALCSPAALAYRPFDSTDAAVADRDEIEIEIGPAQYERLARQHFLVAPALVVNWGFADRWEAVLEGKQLYAADADAAGPRSRIDDAGMFVKTVLRAGALQDGTGPSVASEIGVLLPPSDGSSGAGASALLIVSQRWPALTLHANASVLWTRSHEPGFFAGLIAEGPDTWTVRPVGEVVFEGERRDRPTSAVLAGGIWRATPAVAVDAAIRLARERAEGAMELRLGLTWAFEL